MYYTIKFVFILISDISVFRLPYLSNINVNFKLYFDFERTWWRLFQKRVVCTKFDIYVFIFWPFLKHYKEEFKIFLKSFIIRPEYVIDIYKVLTS
jgi:hypothetical protein